MAKNKIDFNVALINENGEVVTQYKPDPEKTTVDAQGRVSQAAAADAEGNPIKEPVLLSGILTQLVNTTFPDDSIMTYSDRVKRGKLARKVADKTKGSLKNYSTEEVSLLKLLLEKGQATPLLAIQFEDIVEGVDAESESAAA